MSAANLIIWKITISNVLGPTPKRDATTTLRLDQSVFVYKLGLKCFKDHLQIGFGDCSTGLSSHSSSQVPSLTRHFARVIFRVFNRIEFRTYCLLV